MKNHCLIKNQIESFRITSVKRLPIIRFMLLGVLFVLLIPARVFSQTATQPAGYGDSGSPYQIATLENLYWMSANAGSVSQAYCIQTADIDASSTSGWTNGWIPIGGTSAFEGSYDGQGHIISNLTIRSGASNIGWGLFDYLKGSVLNLGLTNVNIPDGGSGTGALAGSATYRLDPNDGITIIPCTITNCYSTGTVTASSLGGGLVGKIDGGQDQFGVKGCVVSNCFSSCTVTGTGTDGSEFGGFVGRIAFNAEVTRCYATGSASYIYSAYDAGWVGGFVGEMDNGAYVNNCYARGNSTAAAGDYPGGFVGYVADGTVTIDKCYSTGVPSGSSNSGGFSGFGAASYSFWDSQTSGQANSGGGMSKTTAQMKDITTFRGVSWWIDPSTGWAMNASINNGYPYLSPFFTIAAPVLTITSFTPTSAGSGTTVTITGTNFTGATAVSFGGTAATSKTVVSSTSITAVVASGTTGSVSVTTPEGTVALTGFTYAAAPGITSFTPTSASSGTTVTITGTNFTGATAVSFGGTAATSKTVLSSTSITAVVASGTSGSVSVSTPGGTATLTGFTYIACSNPTSGGTISAVQTICSGFVPAAFTSSAAATGNTGTLEYKWQISTTNSSGGFSDITSSNAETYAPVALTATTWYKRLARVDCMADWTGAVASNVVAVTVNQPSFSPGTFTVANLQATGSNIQWYTASSGGTALATSTVLVNGTHYYASQTVNGVESTARFDATATILQTPCVPSGSATQTYTTGATVASLQASGTSIRWYAASSGGAALATSTALVNGTHYYATQTISCTESATRLNVTANAAPLAIGDSYGGGIVAYILQAADPGYNASVQHGLIVATADLTSGVWGNTTIYVSNTNLGIGYGSANTDLIIAADVGTTAASRCKAYNGGGYNNWYLASLNEMKAIYGASHGTITYSNGFYWTSSDNNQYPANPRQPWEISMINSSYYDWYPKSSVYAIRPVRNF